MDRHISFIIDTQGALDATAAASTSPEQPSPMDPVHCFVLGCDAVETGDTLIIRATGLGFRGEDALVLQAVGVSGGLSPPQLQVREVKVPAPDFNEPLQLTLQTVSDHAWTCQLNQPGACTLTLSLGVVARDCTPRGFFTLTLQLQFAA